MSLLVAKVVMEFAKKYIGSKKSCNISSATETRSQKPYDSPQPSKMHAPKSITLPQNAKKRRLPKTFGQDDARISALPTPMRENDCNNCAVN